MRERAESRAAEEHVVDLQKRFLHDGRLCGRGAGDDGKVDPPVLQRAERFVGVEIRHAEADVRITGVKQIERVEQKVVQRRLRRAEIDRPAVQPDARMDRRFAEHELFAAACDVFVKRFALGGQFDAAAFSDEKAAAELMLQRLDAVRHVRLARAKHVGGACEIPVFSGVVEDAIVIVTDHGMLRLIRLDMNEINDRYIILLLFHMSKPRYTVFRRDAPLFGRGMSP